MSAPETAVVLKEYQDWRGQLSDDDAAYLAAAFKKQLSARREVASEGVVDVLNPNQYVGVMMLPSGRRLESQPKVSVRNVFYMLAVGSRMKSPFLDELADYESFDDLLEFVARYFAGLVQQQLERGLFRSYIEVEENLPFIRGQILMAPDIRHNYVLRHRSFCRYSDFTWDIPENQVLRQVAHQLAGWNFSPEARRELASIDVALSEVSPSRHAIDLVDSFQYHRQNQDYEVLHSFCRLFMASSSLGDREGEHSFQTFLLDMNQLFESYVSVLAEDAFRGGELWVKCQWQTHLDDAFNVKMKPDVAVLGPGGKPVLIADAKYKRLDAGDFIHHDLYQMVAYLLTSQVERGLLVYPRHADSVDDVVRVRNSSVEVRRFSFDLGGSLEELRLEEHRLAELLLSLARG